jgi:hypothetical protein
MQAHSTCRARPYKQFLDMGCYKYALDHQATMTTTNQDKCKATKAHYLSSYSLDHQVIIHYEASPPWKRYLHSLTHQVIT